MSKKIYLKALLIAPELIDKISETINVDKETLKELLNAVEEGNFNDAVQIFMIINGKVTVDELKEVLNFKNVEVLEKILEFAPEVLEEKENIAERLLEEGFKIPSWVAINRLLANPELAEYLPPSFLGQLLLENLGLADKVDDAILAPALATLTHSEVASLLTEKADIAPLLSEDLLTEAIQLVPEEQKKEVIKKLLSTNIEVPLQRRIIHENLPHLDQKAIEIGINDRETIDKEMAQEIAKDLPLNPLITLLHHYPNIDVDTKTLAQVLRKSPNLVQKLEPEKLEDSLSHLLPKECLPILEKAEKERYLLFFRYVLQNEVELLHSEHFETAIDLGLDSNEITKKILQEMQQEALDGVLTTFPKLAFNLDVKELPVPLVRKIIEGLNRDTLFQKLSNFPTEVADALYKKLREDKSRFWEEMKTITDEKADIIAAVVAYAPQKIRSLFLNTYGETLKEKASELDVLVDLMQGKAVKVPKEKLPPGFLSKLYIEGVSIDPNTIWDEIREHPWALKKVAKNDPATLIENIQETPLENFIQVLDIMEKEDLIEAFKKMSVGDMVKSMAFEGYFVENIDIWERVVPSYPRLCLIPQAPPKIRVEAALRIDSREILNEIIDRVGIKAIGEKAFAVLRKEEKPLSDPMVKECLSNGEKLSSGAFTYLLYLLVNEAVTPEETSKFLQTEVDSPHKDLLIKHLKTGGTLGLASGLVDVGIHKLVPQRDVIEAFGQPTLFHGEIGADMEVTSNMVASILLQHVKLGKEKKLLGSSFNAKEMIEKEEEIPVEGTSYDQKEEDRLIGTLIAHLTEKGEFELPVFLIMSYTGELLPEDFSLKGKLDEFKHALEAAEKSKVQELREAVTRIKKKIKELTKEKKELYEKDEGIPQAPPIEEVKAKKIGKEELRLKKEVEDLLNKLKEPFEREKEEE
ncbi:MAG: hypothetical protein GWO20_03125 [Candidatus Korarchaeota archaeon]|nr:hypothetical protein [Candidatus Korarchaeota archaeon]NIU82479.1 hypothetical protein [Candidatus Thorarchaeota archaeon]NIW12965.1 hypothetical protein [Candidatus Thorarchaeota archaeon]NIW51118.1 hypothetical protein [Candidatus Korarchaeota archaeon]